MADGWIILNKPKGLSSTQATSRVKRLIGMKKAGHAGTLDPFATGVLPIALGEATKTMPYAVWTEKAYEFQITWGEQRDTDDLEGQIIATSTHRPTAIEIQAVLPQFKGELSQMPPRYSALKIAGVPAYRLARQGEEFSLKARKVQVLGIDLVQIDSRDQATFRITCGAGTYVRSLARDIAEALGTKGYVSVLTRTRVGKFTLLDTISLENLENIRHKREWWRVLLPLSAVLDDIPAVTVAENVTLKIRQGQAVFVDTPMEGPVTLWSGGILLAIAAIDQGWARPNRVFHLTKED